MSSEPLVGAVVLGAQNLGGAISRDLLASGIRVATVARTQADLDALEAEGAITVRADAADPSSCVTHLAARPPSSGRST